MRKCTVRRGAPPQLKPITMLRGQKEYVSSLSLLDVADEARALEIAAMTPFASVRQVEVWPVMHESGEA